MEVAGGDDLLTTTAMLSQSVNVLENQTPIESPLDSTKFPKMLIFFSRVSEDVEISTLLRRLSVELLIPLSFLVKTLFLKPFVSFPNINNN